MGRKRAAADPAEGEKNRQAVLARLKERRDRAALAARRREEHGPGHQLWQEGREDPLCPVCDAPASAASTERAEGDLYRNGDETVLRCEEGHTFRVALVVLYDCMEVDPSEYDGDDDETEEETAEEEEAEA